MHHMTRNQQPAVLASAHCKPCYDQHTARPTHINAVLCGCMSDHGSDVVLQAPAERACSKFAVGASVADIQAVNPRPIKRSTIVSYIAAAAAHSSEAIDFGRLAEEAGLTYQTAASIVSGTALLRRERVVDERPHRFRCVDHCMLPSLLLHGR